MLFGNMHIPCRGVEPVILALKKFPIDEKTSKGQSRSSAMMSFQVSHMTFYQCSRVTVCTSCISSCLLQLA